MTQKKRYLTIGLITFGLIIVFGQWFGAMTVVALLLMGYGIYKVRQGEAIKTGFVWLGIGAILFLLDNLITIVAIILISWLIFYLKAKGQQELNHVQRQNFMSDVHWDRDPWALRNTSMWHVLGEYDIDLSLAIVEGNQAQLMLSGIVGDIDLIISEDYGIEIEAFVLFGKIEFGADKENGILNRVVWKSPNYDLREQKVKIVISYLVGDVEIRFS